MSGYAGPVRRWNPDTDSRYVELKAGPGTETREVTEGLDAELDANGGMVGFDIDHASARFDLSTLETEALPARSAEGWLTHTDNRGGCAHTR